jgi:hypothetical protein
LSVVTEALKNIELQDRPIVHERAQLAGLEGLEPGRQVGAPRGRQFRTQNSEGLRGPLTSRRFLDGLIFSRGDQAVFGD